MPKVSHGSTLKLSLSFLDPTTGTVAPTQAFDLPLDESNPKAWTDLFKYLLEHPEILQAIITLFLMILSNTPTPTSQRTNA